jgi:hypothetical protein
MKKLPDWFEGEIYEIGDEVRNPFSGETCLLNANELSMYDLIKGAEIAVMMGVVDDVDKYTMVMVDGSEWFKKNNPKAYKALLD